MIQNLLHKGYGIVSNNHMKRGGKKWKEFKQNDLQTDFIKM